MNPLVSVIIPAYNTEKYIDCCLRSVVNQTYLNLEIIVINDASTDNTLSKIQSFAQVDGRIQIIDNAVNLGNGNGRNTAIKAATGKYVIFVDSDDYIESTMIEKLCLYAEAGNYDTVVVGCRIHTARQGRIMRKTTDIIPSFHPETDKEDRFAHVLLQQKGLHFQPWKYFVKKQLLDTYQIWFDDSGIWFEDVIYTVKMSYYSSKMGTFKEPLYHYIQRKGSITNTSSIKSIKDRISAYLAVKNFLKEQRIFEKYKDEYTMLFVRSAIILPVFDYIKMDKEDMEVKSFLCELLCSEFVQNFDVKNLSLPVIQKEDFQRGDMSYKKIQRIINVLKHPNFAIAYLKIMHSLLKPFHKLSA